MQLLHLILGSILCFSKTLSVPEIHETLTLENLLWQGKYRTQRGMSRKERFVDSSWMFRNKIGLGL